MGLAFLKKIRIIISLIFFLATFLLFVDFHNFFYRIADQVLFFQFVPSLLDTFILFTASSLGFIFVILLALVFGRIYCSTICPLGTLQDIITWISRKTKSAKIQKKFHRYSLPWNKLRYSLLILVIITVTIGSFTFMDLLEPYSNFGRIVTTFFKPMAIFFNNSSSWLLAKFDNYSILPAVYRKVTFSQILIPALFFVLILWLSNKYGRLYCNTICPVGTLLGFLSRFSIFKIAIDSETCNKCGLCVYECKAGCINRKEKQIDFSRCVSCYNCFSACDSGAVYFRNSLKTSRGKFSKKILATDEKKRNFIRTSILLITAFSRRTTMPDSVKINKNVVVKNPSRIPENKQWLVLPPGAKDIKHFTAYCTGCTLCVSACMNNVLQPSFLEFGLEGMMQPYMNYSTGFCNYDCKICGDVCPTNAIAKCRTIDEKKTIQMGKVNFIKENCVVFTELTDCGACSEHCPTKAVNMVPFENTGLFIPEVDDTICIGCGACEFPCPVRPYKAIFVDGNPVQLVAKKPKIEKLNTPELKEDEFPF